METPKLNHEHANRRFYCVWVTSRKVQIRKSELVFQSAQEKTHLNLLAGAPDLILEPP